MLPCIKRWLISKKQKLGDKLWSEYHTLDNKFYDLKLELADETKKIEADVEAKLKAEIAELDNLRKAIKAKIDALDAQVIALVKKLHL